MAKYALGVFIAFFTWVDRVYPQNQHVVDSLREVIRLSDGTEKYNAWHKLVVEHIDHDNNKALALMAEAEAAAVSSRDSVCILRSKKLRGQILFRLDKPQAVIRLLQPLLLNGHLQEVGEEYLSVANLLAVCHIVMSDFDQALEYLFLTSERARHDNNAYYMAVSVSNIGVVYYKLKDYEKALPFMIAGYQKQDSLGILRFGTTVNVSLCYSNLEMYDRALEFLQKSISLCGDECNAQGLTHIKYASGYIFYGLKQYDKAEAEFLASLESSRRVNDHRMELDNIYLLAKISMEKNDLRKAEHYLHAGDHLIQKKIPFNMEAIKVYSELSELYLRLRKFERASFYQSRYIALRDSIYNETLMTNLMKIESGYLQRENEAKIAAQKELIMLKERILTRQRALQSVTVFFAITAVALLVVFVKGYRAKRSLAKLLDQRVQERTSELENGLKNILTRLREQELQISKLTASRTEAITSLEALCCIARREITDTRAEEYLQKISSIVSELAQPVRNN